MPALEVLGWDAGWAVAFGSVANGAAMIPGRIVVAHRDAWRVTTGAGDLTAGISGRLRAETRGPAVLPTVGDWVIVEPHEGEAKATIVALLERRTALGRAAGSDGDRTGADAQVLAANVDVVLVVGGLDHDLNLARLERYLAVAWSSGATPIVLLNKSDIDPYLEDHRAAVEAIAPGVDVLAISARDGTGVDEVRARIGRARTAVVVGSSGVGKSTLLNALVGGERARTANVREDDSRGRHTTVARELVVLADGGLLIDTPGLRALSVGGASDGLAETFADIAGLSADCRFGDCRHESEPGCAVLGAVEAGIIDAKRLARYHKLEREVAMVARRSDPIAARTERRRWASIGRSVEVQMRAKYGDDA